MHVQVDRRRLRKNVCVHFFYFYFERTYLSENSYFGFRIRAFKIEIFFLKTDYFVVGHSSQLGHALQFNMQHASNLIHHHVLTQPQKICFRASPYSKPQITQRTH